MLGIVLLIQGLIFYVNDYPLIRTLLGLNDESGQVLVGYVVKKEGTLQRQLSGDTSFKALEIKNPVYNKDVLVTGPGSEALIQFQKGGGVRLGPSSMIRISFVSGLDLGGIKRHTSVELVSGKMVNQSSDDAVVVKAQGKTFAMKAGETGGLEIKAGAAVNLSPASTKGFDFLPQQDLNALVKKLEAEKPKEDGKSIPTAVLAPIKAAPAPVAVVPAKLIRILAGPVFDDTELLVRGSLVEKKLVMKWDMEPEDQGVQLLFWKLSDDRKSISKEPVLKESFHINGHRGYYEWKGVPPGPYVWEILDDKGGKLPQKDKSRGQIEISRKLDVIYPLPPMVSGRRNYSNKIDRALLKDFSVTLEWKAIEGVDRYEVHLSKNPEWKQPDKIETVNDTHFTFSKNQILSGVQYYKIQARLDNGYIIQSPVQKLNFQFLPPTPVTPLTGQILSKRLLQNEEQNRILFAWQKTNFTTAYEIEVSADEQFQTILLKKVVPQNYFAFPNPKAGQYFWRVRSIAKDVASQMSEPQKFIVGP